MGGRAVQVPYSLRSICVRRTEHVSESAHGRCGSPCIWKGSQHQLLPRPKDTQCTKNLNRPTRHGTVEGANELKCNLYDSNHSLILGPLHSYGMVYPETLFTSSKPLLPYHKLLLGSIWCIHNPPLSTKRPLKDNEPCVM